MDTPFVLDTYKVSAVSIFFLANSHIKIGCKKIVEKLRLFWFKNDNNSEYESNVSVKGVDS